jgi:hypothetical protein
MDVTGKSVQSVADLLAPAKDNRPIYRYKVPASLKDIAGGVVELGFKELNPDEELMATKRCGNQPIRLAFEQARESLCEFGQQGPNGIVRTAVRTGDGTSDRLWMKMHPKLRTLCITAYAELHNPKDSEAADFLESREVSVG